MAIEAEPPLAYVVPQRWAFDHLIDERVQVLVRADREIRGRLVMTIGGVLAYQGKKTRIPRNRQLRFRIGEVDAPARTEPIRVAVVPSG